MLIAVVMIFSCVTVAFATGDELNSVATASYKKGDVNMDSEIDVKDVILVLRHIVGMITFTKDQCSLADMDSNSEVNVSDALYIQKLIVNTQETPTEKPTVPGEFEEDDKPIELPIVPAD